MLLITEVPSFVKEVYLTGWNVVYRIPSFCMLRRVALVRNDVSVKHMACIIRVTRIGELETRLAVTSNKRTLLVTANVVSSSQILFALMMEVIFLPRNICF
jgi:hypothetical protein